MVLNEDKIQCLLDDARGIYIPQAFVENYNHMFSNQFKENLSEDILICEHGPEHAEYWDAWQEITDHFTWIDQDGNTWRLWQDGDLFLAREDYEFDNNIY